MTDVAVVGPGPIELPGHGSCYICGDENPAGLGLRFRLDGAAIRTEFTLTEQQQGPPGHAHGGCLAAIVDEAMGAAAWCAGYPVLAARIEVDFRRSVPLGVEHTVSASVESVVGRKVWVCGEIRGPDGQVATSARGLYIEARKSFDRDFFVPRL